MLQEQVRVRPGHHSDYIFPTALSFGSSVMPCRVKNGKTERQAEIEHNQKRNEGREEVQKRTWMSFRCLLLSPASRQKELRMTLLCILPAPHISGN